MKKLYELIKNKSTVYTLSFAAFFALAVFSTGCSGMFNTSDKTSHEEMSEEKKDTNDKYHDSPATRSYKRQCDGQGCYHKVTKSLSPKAKNAFQTLPKEDKDRIQDAHEEGKNPHKELKKVLDEDHKDHTKKKTEDMKEETPKQQSYYD